MTAAYLLLLSDELAEVSALVRLKPLGVQCRTLSHKQQRVSICLSCTCHQSFSSQGL